MTTKTTTMKTRERSERVSEQSANLYMHISVLVFDDDFEKKKSPPANESLLSFHAIYFFCTHKPFPPPFGGGSIIHSTRERERER